MSALTGPDIVIEANPLILTVVGIHRKHSLEGVDKHNIADHVSCRFYRLLKTDMVLQMVNSLPMGVVVGENGSSVDKKGCKNAWEWLTAVQNIAQHAGSGYRHQTRTDVLVDIR